MTEIEATDIEPEVIAFMPSPSRSLLVGNMLRQKFEEERKANESLPAEKEVKEVKEDKEESKRITIPKTSKSGMSWPEFRNYYKGNLMQWKPFVTEDKEGSELLTFTGKRIFAHAVNAPDGKRYFMNNSTQPRVPDYIEQIGPYMKHLEQVGTQIENVDIIHYKDTRLYLNIRFKALHKHHEDTRIEEGGGLFRETLKLSCSLTSDLKLRAQLSLERLVCANGMFAVVDAGEVYVRKKTSGFSVNHNISTIDLSSTFDFYRAMDRMAIEEAVAQQILDQMPAKHRKIITEQVGIEGKSTLYTIYQAMAYVITHAELEELSRNDLRNKMVGVLQPYFKQVQAGQRIAVV